MGTQYFGTGRLGTVQDASFTSSAAGTITNAVSAQIRKVRVLVTSDAYVKIGTAPTAATTDTYMVGLLPEYFSVTPGQKVSAFGATSTAGTLNVTEIDS